MPGANKPAHLEYFPTYIHSAPAINLGFARNVRSDTVGRADLECAFLLPRNSQFVSQKSRVLNDDMATPRPRLQEVLPRIPSAKSLDENHLMVAMGVDIYSS